MNYLKVFTALLGSKRLLVPLVFVLALGLLIAQPARMKSGSTDSTGVTLGSQPYIPGQVVVQLNPGFDVVTIATMYGLDPVSVGQIQAGIPLATKYLLRIIDGSAVEQKIAQLVADILRIASAEPNYNYTAPEAARPTWSVGDSYASIPAGRKFYNS